MIPTAGPKNIQHNQWPKIMLKKVEVEAGREWWTVDLTSTLCFLSLSLSPLVPTLHWCFSHPLVCLFSQAFYKLNKALCSPPHSFTKCSTLSRRLTTWRQRRRRGREEFLKNGNTNISKIQTLCRKVESNTNSMIPFETSVAASWHFHSDGLPKEVLKSMLPLVAPPLWTPTQETKVS